MSATAPLQLIIFRNEADRDVAPFEDAVVRAFQGGKEAGGYLATGDDLGIQLEIFSGASPNSVAHTLDSFSHTLTVVLVDTEFLAKSDEALWDWLAQCSLHTSASNGRHAMLVVAMEERLGDGFAKNRAALATLQWRPVHELGERAIRPAMLALLVLHECRLLLANALPAVAGNPAGYLRLFISHAKIDGLPLAQALKYQINSIGWLRSFYDADDLPAGCDWQRELERGVGSSLIIMLRTEAYDGRHWCQQEVRWADEYATPAVLVEARTGLNHPGAALPFDRVPAVRIPDGNLMRILFLALREGLRFLHFMRLIEEMERCGDLPKSERRVFSFPPSMAALLRACRSLADAKASTNALILYPDPPLRTGVYEAAQSLVAAYSPGTQLVTPNTLAALRGSPR